MARTKHVRRATGEKAHTEQLATKAASTSAPSNCTVALSKFSSRDCEFVEQTSKDFDCPVCFQVIWTPFLTACCGNHFCEACVKTTKEKSDQCPFCSEKPISGITDKKFQRQINELRVYCLNKKHGCSWVGELGELTKHLNGECKSVLLPCSLSCGKEVIRCELDEHLTEECPLRTYTCEYCDYSSTHKDVTTIHYSDCPNYPVICPNSCSEELLKRSNIESHLLTCPDEVVSCSFTEMGCEEKMKRRCLQQHIEANVMQHQLMICDAFRNVKKENETLKDYVRDLKKENEVFKDDLRKENEALKVDIKILKQKNEELQKNDASVQSRMDHSTNGFVLKMDEGIAADQWKEYFTSLVMVSTNTPKPVCPVIIKWPDYSQLIKGTSVSSRFGDTDYFTRPFYTHHNGYKMQLSISPYGNNNITHISVYCYFMGGLNDNYLKWPFKGVISITLLNQLQNDEHVTKSFGLGDSIRHADTVKKPISNGIRNQSCWGYSEFVSLSEVESSTAHKQYLMNDTLYFRINVDVMT